jgi:hypothetical protein
MRPHPLQCPFCDNYLIAPIDITLESVEIRGGICKCRAVYVLDQTGHNLGQAFMDALTFVCRGDIDKAVSLEPGDYETVEFNYDLQTNTTGRTDRPSKLLFVKLKIELNEAQHGIF